MGIYFNPGNEGFQRTLNRKYIDKTGLICLINEVLGTDDMLTCISRPRRFGKTLAAKMLCAYYDKSCDSRSLFEGLEISKDKSFDEHLNKYDVIYLDITRFIARAGKVGNVVSDIQKGVIQELREAYPGYVAEDTTFLPDALFEISLKTKDKFFFIIDEWDALFREAKDDVEIQKSYIKFLRGLFKGGPASDKTLIGAYMTGILPIKKYGTESALTDFREYTMVNPAKFARYVGFTEDEVKKLCECHNMEFSMMEQWYDGYSFSKMEHIYSPNSVMSAIRNEEFCSYWTQSESYESLQDYISMNMNGLKDAVISMLGGQRVRINPLSFQNDITSMNTRDKVLTLLVHLGYLAYDSRRKEAYIPNFEVADAFKLAVEDTGWEHVGEALRRSAELLEQTIAGNSDYVASALVLAHESSASVLQYNDENSMACALTIAYYTAQSDYTIVRELPSGKGFVDLAFIPCRHSDKPAMIMELKYNKSADTAIQQIKDKRYQGCLKDFGENLLLVGINYNKGEKEYSCVIEKISDINL